MSPKCRICLTRGDVKDLCSPCNCKGSMSRVHGKCILKWVIKSKNTKCEICGYKWVDNQSNSEINTVNEADEACCYFDIKTLKNDIIRLFNWIFG